MLENVAVALRAMVVVGGDIGVKLVVHHQTLRVLTEGDDPKAPYKEGEVGWYAVKVRRVPCSEDRVLYSLYVGL